MSAIGFDQDVAVVGLADGKYRTHISASWKSQTGANGGYVGAILLNAMLVEVDDADRQLRSFSIRFLSPARPGAATVEVKVHKAGRSLTSVEAALHCDDRVVATASATLARARVGFTAVDRAMPAVAWYTDIPQSNLMSAETPGYMPFRAKYDQLFAIGPKPPDCGDGARSGGWVRLKEDRPWDALAIVAIADAWIPSSYVNRNMRLSGAPTLDLSIQMVGSGRLEKMTGRYVLVDFETSCIQAGYLVENGWIWAEDGELIACVRQFAVVQAEPGLNPVMHAPAGQEGWV